MLWFRIGSIAMIITCFLHLIGHFSGMTASNETEKQMLDLMSSYTLQPLNITMMDLFNGFSLFYALFFLMAGELNLWLARALKGNPSELKKVAAVNIIGLSIGTVVSVIYFFSAPIIYISAALAYFVIAFVMLSREERSAGTT
jgi:multisubunit Na+/H+ antiporter MnhF subunit